MNKWTYSESWAATSSSKNDSGQAHLQTLVELSSSFLAIASFNDKGSPALSVGGQTVNISSSVGYMVFVATAQLRPPNPVVVGLKQP